MPHMLIFFKTSVPILLQDDMCLRRWNQYAVTVTITPTFLKFDDHVATYARKPPNN